MIKAVIFDLDNTIMDRHGALHAFAADQHRRLFASQQPHVPAAAYRQRFVALDDNGRLWKDAVYQQLIAEFDLRATTWEQLLDEYITRFRLFCQPLPGFATMLASLQAANYRLGLITNGSYPFQKHNFAALGVAEAFELVMVSEQEGLRKPDPRLFQRALERLGVTATEAVYVGDNPIADIEGAHSVGMPAIFRPSPHWATCPTADATCTHLADLADILAGLS